MHCGTYHVFLRNVLQKRYINLQFADNEKDPSHMTGPFPYLISLFMSIGTLVDINTRLSGVRVLVQ